MHINEPATLVVGGGIAGLFGALLIAEQYRPGTVYLLERADEVGGLLKSVDGGRYGRFDLGMHTFPTSGVREVDRCLEGLLQDDEWIVLEGARRDVSGIIYEGKLQTGCHYPDLNLLPKEFLDKCIADFFVSLQPDPLPTATDMEMYATNRFGPLIAKHVIAPIVENHFGCQAVEIDTAIVTVLPLDRIAFFSESVFKQLLHSPLLRSRVAYPDQRNLDIKYSSGNYSLYPKASGAYRLIDALVQRLAVCGVKIVTTATIRSTEVLHGTLRQVAVQTSEDTLIFSNVARVLWTAGISSLARTLALSVPSTPIKIHRRNAIVNLLISEPPNMEDLYYYWGFDRNYRTFRVTNFANYCPSAQRADGYPVAVELFLHPEDPTGTEGVLSLAIKELEAFGVLRPDSKIVFHKSQVLNGGFPVLSAQSKRLHQDTSAAIASLDLKNLVISGMQASWGLILQPDVLKHTFAEIHRSFGA